MCNPIVLSTIVEVIDEKVGDELAFTAFDITQEVRRRLPGEDIPHYQVRNEITRLYHAGQITDYKREQGSGYATQVQPMVYAMNFNGNIQDDPQDDTADEPTDLKQKEAFWDSLKKLIGIS